jgi:CRISPR-associated endonuclease/helicase Cas3
MASKAFDFPAWFRQLTGFPPHPWQASLADDPTCRDRLLRIPTGFGKTAGAVLPWLHHRVLRGDGAWPARLVVCLPMRVLVEQTASVIQQWLDTVAPRPALHVLMGGTHADRWELQPEAPTVLVGTQDMLLSRALNRGYGIGRARWPLGFGLLHQDTLWVLDEVQLMDVGLATSSQLAAFRAHDARRPTGSLRPCFTWWMSATLQPRWLATVDHEQSARKLAEDVVHIPASARKGGLWEVTKRIERHRNAQRPVELASLARERHRPGTTTLIVVNRVERAVEVFRALDDTRYEGKAKNRRLRTEDAGLDLQLVHSRFRGHERAAWAEFLHRNATVSPAGRILVATQVVEAGVDISAATLITDLCPWSSLVQRIGRCARYEGQTGLVVVTGDASEPLPYDNAELEAADEALALILRAQVPDIAPRSVEAFEEQLAATAPGLLTRLYALAPAHVLRRRDLDELFDTTPDLTGTDLDVSRYIRSGDERDARVFWRDVPAMKRKLERSDVPPIRREELCPVPVNALRTFLHESGRVAYALDYLSGDWHKVEPKRIVPSMNILLPSNAGGYEPLQGWNPKHGAKVEPVPVQSEQEDAVAKLALASESEQDDRLSHHERWKTIATHGRETAAEARAIAQALRLPDRFVHVLDLAARWHDVGKAHETFQKTITDRARSSGPPLAQRNDLAKAPDDAWQRPPYQGRPGFRHELASTLALLELLRRTAPTHAALLGPHAELLELIGTPPELPTENEQVRQDHPLAREIAALSAADFDLLLWLVCTHHGKVRCRLTSTPHDQDAGHGGIFGVVDDDALPSIAVSTATGTAELVPDMRLSLATAAMGVSARYGASWGERGAGLVREHGPFTVAYLEAILRAADARASQLDTEDPLG